MKKRRYITALLGIALSVSLVGGCTKKQDTSSKKSNIVYGEVCSISDDSITIKVGNLKTNSQVEQERKELEETSSNSSDTAKDPASSLDLTGKKQTIKLTDETSIQIQNMGSLIDRDAEALEQTTEKASDKEDDTTQETTMPQNPQANNGEPKDSELKELKEGDTVQITLDKKKRAQTITINSDGRN